jgi:hypothetical protein
VKINKYLYLFPMTLEVLQYAKKLFTRELSADISLIYKREPSKQIILFITKATHTHIKFLPFFLLLVKIKERTGKAVKASSIALLV